MGWMDSGGGGAQTTTQEFKPPEWTTPGWQTFATGAANYASKPYEPFDGMRVAPINGYQMQGMNFLEDRALTGAPDLNAGRMAAMHAAQGNYANPWAGNVSGIAQGFAYNPYAEGLYGLSQRTNPYTSDEYTQQILNQTASAMARAYAEGGAAQNDAAATMAGAYGGGGWQAMKDRGEANLAGEVGKMASNLLQSQQQYKGAMYNQDYANMLQSLGLGTQMYMGDVANQLQANQQGAGIWQNDVGNMLQGAALGGQLSADDWIAGQQLMNIGNFQNQYVQQLLNTQYGDWLAAQQYPAQMLDILGSALGRASGSYGTSIAQQSIPGMNPMMGLLGLGSAAYGMF